MKIEQLAIILYTLRDHIQTAEGFRRTISKVADIGFQNIQLSGVPVEILSAEEIRQICADHGIAICATHESSQKIIDDPQWVVDRLKALGTNYTAYPYPAAVDLSDPQVVDHWLTQLEASTQHLRANGLTLAYHNHNHEFARSRGKTLMEHIYTRTSIAAELDTYWIQAGGASPLAWVQKMASQNRLPLLHMKDFRIALPVEMQYAEIGSGNIEFAPIIQAADAGGCAYYIVEQDQTYGRDPFESITDSFRYTQQNFIQP